MTRWQFTASFDSSIIKLTTRHGKCILFSKTDPILYPAAAFSYRYEMKIVSIIQCIIRKPNTCSVCKFQMNVSDRTKDMEV